MINTVESISDADLVSHSLSGDREAFGHIVARYQTLICSLAYSRTGSLTQSEDLAQETFITAWKQLSTLREPHKLRSWLCGIARNRIFDALKKQGREPSHAAELLDAAHESPGPDLPPHNVAISKEEEAILWRAIERIPENYREPLVLFYREHQSVQAVAANLELSEDAVKQRLSRGRKLLQEQVVAFVEGALGRTNPGQAFTMSVLAALPMAAFSAKAATIGAAAKGGTMIKGLSLGAFGWLIGPVIGVACGIMGWRNSLKGARTPRERAFIMRQGKISIIAALVFTGCLLSFNIVTPSIWKKHVVLLIVLGLMITFGFAAFIFIATFRFNRRFAELRQEEEELHPEILQNQPNVGPMFAVPWEYRSRITLFGVPLVHCRGGRRRGEKMKPAIGWIAYGDKAYGLLLASGGIAVAPISMGGLSIGLISIGGFGVGLFAFGGFAFGAVTLGGAAIGLIASGGIAVGWHAAMGGMAIAHDLALAGSAVAPHANDDVARHFFLKYHWLDFTRPGSNVLFWSLCFGPVILQIWILQWWSRRMMKRVASNRG